MNILTRDEQRSRASQSAQNTVNLWFHLQNLIREIRAGDTGKLSEFQQFVQYAPEGMREQLLDQIDAKL